MFKINVFNFILPNYFVDHFNFVIVHKFLLMKTQITKNTQIFVFLQGDAMSAKYYTSHSSFF